MKYLSSVIALFVLTGCLGTPIKPKNVFEKSEALSPYFIANKYFEIMERCWFKNNPDFDKYYQLETFPPASLGKYDISTISLVLEPKPTPTTSPPSILTMRIEKLSSNGYLESDRNVIDSSHITVFVNNNIYPKESLKWLDIKRWANGEEDCLPQKIEL